MISSVLIFLSLSGFGGTFLLKEGKVKQHVMPDFSKTPINSDEDLNKWLKFFEMSAPLVAVGTFATCDPVSLLYRINYQILSVYYVLPSFLFQCLNLFQAVQAL